MFLRPTLDASRRLHAYLSVEHNLKKKIKKKLELGEVFVLSYRDKGI